jgi:hypothetical protein
MNGFNRRPYMLHSRRIFRLNFTPQISPFERFSRQLGVGAMHTMANVLGFDGLSLR